MAAAAFRSADEDTIEPRSWALLLWVAYIVHQFEEHWIDLFGRIYAFHGSLNELLSGLTGSESGVEFISPASIFVINTSLVWLVGALAVLLGARHIFAVLCMTAIAVVNAVSHIGAGLVTGTYNPGLLTALILFLPFGVAAYVWLVHTEMATVRLVLASLLWAFLAHVIMVAGILAMHWFGWIPELAYFTTLVVWSLLPAFLFSHASQPPSPDV
ncbi:MAG: HXXEE domain-containing protein [Pseudomonadota bacterium]